MLIVAITGLHLLINAFYGGRVYDVLDRVGTRSHDIRQYRPLFETIAAFPSEVPLFAKLHAHMGQTPREPLDALAGLMRLVRFANLRRDGLFGVPYYLSQLFVLTDFHVLSLMERWQQQHGPAVRRWLEGVGRTEAISSLATFAHDNPHWSMPVVDERPDTTIVARQLGHPLIADDKRSATTSRSVLPARLFWSPARTCPAKARCCARRPEHHTGPGRRPGLCTVNCDCRPSSWRPRCEPVTRSRAAFPSSWPSCAASRKSSTSRERVSKSRNYVSICSTKSCREPTPPSVTSPSPISSAIWSSTVRSGMVSTHDLELAHSPELATACRTVHFRESITGQDGDEQMTFDYVLRPGVSPTTNALKLLKFVGLGD